MARMGAIVLEPVRTLAGVLLLSSFFYGLVALSGRKPEWHTLMTVIVFASFIDAARMLFELVLKLRCASLNVDTSAGAFFPLIAPGLPMPKEAVDIAPAMLSGFDPFRLWYWIVVILGLGVTSQLRGWRGWIPCLLLWVGGAGLRTGLALTTAQQRQKEAAESGVRIVVSDASLKLRAPTTHDLESGAILSGQWANASRPSYRRQATGFEGSPAQAPAPNGLVAT
jgi:hypothetical protein